MISFNYRTINFTCTHCQRVTEDAKAHVASGYNMYFLWKCECGRPCEAMVTFEELTAMMPPDPVSVAKISSSDLAFCKQAKITLEDRDAAHHH